MPDLARAILRPDLDDRSYRMGVVSAYAGGGAALITVLIDGALNTLACVVASYTVGDTVLIGRDGQSAGYVLGRLGTTALATDPNPELPPVEPSVKQRTKTILPVSTGSYRAGWRTDNDFVYQGDYQGLYGQNTGAAFYGSQLTALKADTSKPHSAVLTFRRRRGGFFAGETPTFRLLTEKTRPGGAPTLNETSVGPSVPVDTVATWTVPTAWVTALLNGTRGGVGTYVATDTPYIVLDGLAEYAAAFALKVTYYA